MLMRGREMSPEEAAEIETSVTSRESLRSETSESLAKQLRAAERKFRAFVRAAVAYFMAEQVKTPPFCRAFHCLLSLKAVPFRAAHQARVDGNTAPVPGSPRAAAAAAREVATRSPTAAAAGGVPAGGGGGLSLKDAGRQPSIDQLEAATNAGDAELIGARQAQTMIECDR